MKAKRHLMLFFLSLLFISCQEEKTSTEDTSRNTLNKSSILTGLVSRIVQNPTAKDDVMDDNSHFSIVLPVSVEVNNQNITVTETNNGLQQINYVKSMSSWDDDEVSFQFPITVKFRNYQTQTIVNQSEYDQLVTSLGPCNFLDEIECVELQYPVVVTTYNLNNQEAESFTLTNNAAMYAFINNLGDSDVFNFSYPLSIQDSNQATITIQSDAQFNQVIESNIGQCDPPVGYTPVSFQTILTQGSWYVSSYIDDDGDNETDDFEEYTFEFYSNNDLTVFKNSFFANGSWSYTVNGGIEKLNLNFNDSNFSDLDQDWIILEYTTTTIRLKHIDSDNDVEYLILSKV